MPRLVHRPPKYRRHKTSAIVSVFGKRIHLGPYGSPQSHRRYQEVLKDWEKRRYEIRQAASTKRQTSEQIAAGITADSLRLKAKCGSPVTVAELILVYRRHTASYYRKNGKVTREAGIIDDALRLLRKYDGTTFVDDFGPVRLEALREKMIDDHDWSRNFINKQVNRIRAMFKWASGKEICEASLAVSLRELAGLKKGRTRARETEPVKPVDDAVVDKTLKGLSPVVADMVRIQRLTSARPGEICSMSPADIDRSSDVWVYTPREHKTEHFQKDRLIAIGPRAQSILKKYLHDDPRQYCFSPKVSEQQKRAERAAQRKTPPSCGNTAGSNRRRNPKRKPGERYTTPSYRRAIRRACESLNINRWTPNQLRHTASTAIRKQFGIDAARAVDGHGSTSTTEIYAELDLTKAIDVMRQIG